MAARVLFVDDDAMILSSLRRQMRGVVEADTEEDPVRALELLKEKGPYAAVVSDYRMPGMNGIEFLKKVKASSPDSSRIMLTGYADLDNAMGAVNDGHVFRFLTKPCDQDLLVENIRQGVEQYELVTARRVLLEQTLKGSIELLGEITSLVNPEAYARINRVKRYVRYLAEKKKVKGMWRYEVATMLSQIGCVMLRRN
ncbi:response regulator [Salidesulfovibrio onnuriiensis]|uniref:response regulator n=1 Tax=Salidesulfovibrio onnuriiensis TaxID=2583823 RepID=UPI00202B6D71|nr:response regulator [Salidesulfovibrio onnuriiensis]